jgi:nucleotide-binding universal stress UspA family protein
MVQMPNETQQNAKPYVILAALAFDETGEAALREAARSVGPHSVLHVVHVIREESQAKTSMELEALEQRMNEASERLRGYIEKQWPQAPHKIVAHVRVGALSQSIVQTAVDVNADLLIVGTHQRAGLKKLLLGSVAKQIVDHAHCPVLLALPKDYQGRAHSDSIQPPCTDCLETRKQTQGQQFWCERHQRTYLKPHVYSPSEATHPTSVMPTH